MFLLAGRSSQVPGALTLVLNPAAHSCVTQGKSLPSLSLGFHSQNMWLEDVMTKASSSYIILSP